MGGDLDSLSGWCIRNGIRVNAEKTKTMIFGSPNTVGNLQQFEMKFESVPIQKVSSYKYLGMTLDTRLNYNSHVNGIVSNVSSKLKQFRRMRNFLNVEAAVMVYKSMILPLLEYGDIFLSSTSLDNRKKLQVLQNKGLRCALGREATSSSSEIHGEVNLLKLKFRREQHLLNFMHDWAQDPKRLKVKPSGGVQTRSHRKKMLYVKKPRTEKFKKSFAYRGPKKWNCLSEEFHYADSKEKYKTLVNSLVTQRAINCKGDEGMQSNVSD